MVYDRPETLHDALAILAGGPRTILAGGTDLYPATSAQDLPVPVLDIGAIASLSGISRADGFLRIGAATPWAIIRDAALPPACDTLRTAAAQVGGVQIQSAGTIGGNLCNASPAADGVPPLLVLDAEVELAGPANRRLSLSKFLEGPRATARQVDEILTTILIPEAALTGRSAFLKLGARAHLVISIAMVAVRLATEGGRITGAAIAVGACSPVATRLPGLESRLVGTDGALAVKSDDLAPLDPIDDVRATAAYRLDAAAELVSRAIAEALA